MSSPPVRMRRFAPLLGALAMFGAFSIDTVFPAFPQIGQQFGAGRVAMQQTISAYLVAYAAMSLWHGALSDALGRRRVILAGIAVFAVASAGCALSTSLPMLVGFRVLQGLSAGVGLIVGRAVIRDLFEGAEAQRLMSQVSMIFGIAPALAPVIGGWLLGWQRWPSIFWFLLLFACALFAAVLRWLPETHPLERRRPLQLRIIARTYAAIAADAQFRRLAFAQAFNFCSLFLLIASAPALVLDHFQLGEQGFGWFFIPMIGGMMAGAFVSGRFAGRLDGQSQVRLGFALNVAGALALLGYALVADRLRLPWGIAPVVLMAFGIALVSPVATLMGLDRFPAMRGAAASVQAFIALTLNAVMAGLVSPALSATAHHLAAGSLLLGLLGWGGWAMALRSGDPVPPPPADSGGYEPLDEL